MYVHIYRTPLLNSYILSYDIIMQKINTEGSPWLRASCVFVSHNVFGDKQDHILIYSSGFE